MNVLVLNSGSSSLKFRLFTHDPMDSATERLHAVLHGVVERIGGLAMLHIQADVGAEVQAERQIMNHTEAVHWLFEHLALDDLKNTGAGRAAQIDAVGHRVVHGGERFRHTVRLDADVLAGIDNLSELAPLHNPACLAGIRAAQAALGDAVPMVAVFDTAFHHTLPVYAATYAIPQDLAARHHLRRYGFHGIAHAALAAGYAQATGQQLDTTRLITLQLGNGCSATAIRQGHSVDTSMGLTPLEGLVMGTRCGDLDPAMVSFLMRRESLSAAEVEHLLNERSGLLGVSGLSHDMRHLLQAVEQHQDARAALAIDLFCYRIQKYLGAYLAVLGGADAVVFGGGIGEQSPTIRARICANMDWCGLRLDPQRNAAAVRLPAGSAARISRDDASLAAYVVAVDEETWIARETLRCLRPPEDGSSASTSVPQYNHPRL